MDDIFLYDIVKKYYEKNLTQEAIAKEYGISRVHVSRHLKEAREKGIIKFTLHRPNSTEIEFESLINYFKSKYNLHNLYIVNVEEKDKDKYLSRFAAGVWNLIPAIIPNKKCLVGLGWGKTISTLSMEAMNNTIQRNQWHIYPLSGGLSVLQDNYFDINKIIYQFAAGCSGTHHPIYLPFYFKNRLISDGLKHEKEFQHFLDIWEKLDLILFGIGNEVVSRSPVFREYSISGSMLDKLIRLDVTADILTHFFNSDGDLVEIDDIDQYININKDQILNIKRRIGVACGNNKRNAIRTILKSNFLTDLVIDLSNAQKIMDMEEEE